MALLDYAKNQVERLNGILSDRKDQAEKAAARMDRKYWNALQPVITVYEKELYHWEREVQRLEKGTI